MSKYDMVLSYLQDEMSKRIYKMQMEHTEDALKSIVKQYFPLFQGKYCFQNNQNNRHEDFINDLRHGRNIVVGVGVRGKCVIELLVGAGINVDEIVDNNKKQQGTYLYGIEVKALEDIDYSENDNIIVTQRSSKVVDEVRKQLIKLGGEEKNIVVYNDYLPIEMLEEQYFDEDIIKLNNGEIFVDAGACDMETSFQFMRECKRRHIKDEQIVAFEPDSISYQRCLSNLNALSVNNIVLENIGLWSCNDIVHFKEEGSGSSRIEEEQTGINNELSTVKVVALDNYISNKITFIKMDIEGAELEALKGSEGIIKKYKPKLAICIYHKKEDLIDIPIFIKSIVPEYKLYIRHYSNSFNETVLYAVID